MSLPVLKRCCWCLSLETGCFVLGVASSLACIANIAHASWLLPLHNSRQPEDNLISMSMVMFSTLSLISNVVGLTGVVLRRSGYIQVSFLFNSVFIGCIFMVAAVACLFGPELRPLLQHAARLTLVLLAMVAGAAYSLYYLIVLNSTYRKMKLNYIESTLPM